MGKQRIEKHKPPVTFGTTEAKKLVFGLFLLIALATNIKIPKHKTKPNTTYTYKVMNQFQKVNELYDGTLNEVYHFLYSTDIISNECFTFRNATKK